MSVSIGEYDYKPVRRPEVRYDKVPDIRFMDYRVLDVMFQDSGLLVSVAQAPESVAEYFCKRAGDDPYLEFHYKEHDDGTPKIVMIINSKLEEGVADNAAWHMKADWDDRIVTPTCPYLWIVVKVNGVPIKNKGW